MKKNTGYTDLDLIHKLLHDKDSKWYGILYDRYATKVYNKCIALIHENEDAMDLTHDIFMKAYINIQKLDTNLSFRTGLFAITYNTCVDYLKKSKKYMVVSTIERIKDDKKIVEIDDTEIMSITIDRLEVLLAKIPTDDKVILLMKYQDEMTIMEIGELYKFGENSAKLRIDKAKKELVDLYNVKYRHSIYYLNR